MTRRAAAFAIPGDINTLTGGYIYEKRLLMGLREMGHAVEHIELSASFPDPDPVDMADALARLSAIESERPLILDGLVFGSLVGLEAVTAPVIAMVHHPLALETGLNAGRRAHLFETERRNLEHAGHVLVPSRHTADILQTQYGVAPGKITIAPPGTDRPTQPRVPVDPPLVLSVGLQHPRKGHDVLLRALSDLMDLSWQAIIVGRAHDPTFADMLQNKVRELGLSDRVTLAGEVSRTDLDHLYSQASVFALATRYEGYGIVFDEALSWGLPIISCKTGAVPDTVPRAAGILTDPDDPRAFAGALRQVLENPTLRQSLGHAAAEAGANLAAWSDTAEVASGVLSALR